MNITSTTQKTSHSNILWVVSSGITQKDKEIFNMIFKHTDVACQVSFIDVDLQDVDIQNKNAIVAVGGKALKAIITDIKDKKLYDIKRILGCDFVDPKNKFFVFNIPYAFNEMIIPKENKKEVWIKMLKIKDTYLDLFGDNIPADNTEVAPEESVQDNIQSEDSIPSPSGRYSATEVFNKLIENVQTNDPSLTKSLSKYDKITLECSNGVLNVYPTNRIPDGDTSSISIKDLIILLRISEMLDVKSFCFEQGHGLSLSN